MNLGQLRAKIRAHKGTVTLVTRMGEYELHVPVQKTPFMNETLVAAFGESKMAETPFGFNDGVVFMEGAGGQVSEAASSEPAIEADDDLDLDLDLTDGEAADDDFLDLVG